MFRKKLFTAVILAGGSSERMGGVSKQMLELCGVPVAARSMLAFENCRSCEKIVVVAKESEKDLYPEMAKKYGITKFSCAVTGGQTRRESAFNGSKAAGDADYIALHDAARWLVRTEDIERVFEAARKYNCASASYKAVDTIKTVGKNGKTATEGQPDRSKLYVMQTPQIFLKDLYDAAAYTARENNLPATDDCALLEAVGFGCRLVETDRYNIKITTPDDLAVAEALIREREKRS